MRSFVSGLMLAAAVGCAPVPEPPPPPDVAAHEAAAATLWADYTAAVVSKDVERATSLFSDAVSFQLQGIPPVAKSGLAELYRGLLATTDVVSIELRPEYSNVPMDGLIHQAGSFVEPQVREGKPVTEYGRYATAIAREADGQWRVTFLMGIVDSIVPR